MTTRRELIDGVRQEQRQRSIAAQREQTKSAIVGIGDRDALTGAYSVILPDGTEAGTGEKVFNASVPAGSRVLGIPKDSGGWTLDEKDVKKRVEVTPVKKNGIRIIIIPNSASTASESNGQVWLNGRRITRILDDDVNPPILIYEDIPPANYEFWRRIVKRYAVGGKLFMNEFLFDPFLPPSTPVQQAEQQRKVFYDVLQERNITLTLINAGEENQVRGLFIFRGINSGIDLDKILRQSTVCVWNFNNFWASRIKEYFKVEVQEQFLVLSDAGIRSDGTYRWLSTRHRLTRGLAPVVGTNENVFQGAPNERTFSGETYFYTGAKDSQILMKNPDGQATALIFEQ